jgi:hypothetical protein
MCSTMFSTVAEPAFKKSKTTFLIKQEWRESLPSGFSGSLLLTSIELSSQQWKKRLSSRAFCEMSKQNTMAPLP